MPTDAGAPGSPTHRSSTLPHKPQVKSTLPCFRKKRPQRLPDTLAHPNLSQPVASGECRQACSLNMRVTVIPIPKGTVPNARPGDAHMPPLSPRTHPAPPSRPPPRRLPPAPHHPRCAVNLPGAPAASGADQDTHPLQCSRRWLNRSNPTRTSGPKSRAWSALASPRRPPHLQRTKSTAVEFPAPCARAPQSIVLHPPPSVQTTR